MPSKSGIGILPFPCDFRHTQSAYYVPFQRIVFDGAAVNQYGGGAGRVSGEEGVAGPACFLGMSYQIRLNDGCFAPSMVYDV